MTRRGFFSYAMALQLIWLLSQSPDDFDQPQYNFAREIGLTIVFACVVENPRILEGPLNNLAQPPGVE